LRELEEALEEFKKLITCELCGHKYCEECISADEDFEAYYSHDGKLLTQSEWNIWFFARKKVRQPKKKVKSSSSKHKAA
jgi:hypothetical protein